MVRDISLFVKVFFVKFPNSSAEWPNSTFFVSFSYDFRIQIVTLIPSDWEFQFWSQFKICKISNSEQLCSSLFIVDFDQANSCKALKTINVRLSMSADLKFRSSGGTKFHTPRESYTFFARRYSFDSKISTISSFCRRNASFSNISSTDSYYKYRKHLVTFPSLD